MSAENEQLLTAPRERFRLSRKGWDELFDLANKPPILSEDTINALFGFPPQPINYRVFRQESKPDTHPFAKEWQSILETSPITRECWNLAKRATALSLRHKQADGQQHQSAIDQLEEAPISDSELILLRNYLDRDQIARDARLKQGGPIDEVINHHGPRRFVKHILGIENSVPAESLGIKHLELRKDCGAIVITCDGDELFHQLGISLHYTKDDPTDILAGKANLPDGFLMVVDPKRFELAAKKGRNIPGSLLNGVDHVVIVSGNASLDFLEHELEEIGMHNLADFFAVLARRRQQQEFHRLQQEDIPNHLKPRRQHINNEHPVPELGSDPHRTVSHLASRITTEKETPIDKILNELDSCGKTAEELSAKEKQFLIQLSSIKPIIEKLIAWQAKEGELNSTALARKLTANFLRIVAFFWNEFYEHTSHLADSNIINIKKILASWSAKSQWGSFRFKDTFMVQEAKFQAGCVIPFLAPDGTPNINWIPEPGFKPPNSNLLLKQIIGEGGTRYIADIEEVDFGQETVVRRAKRRRLVFRYYKSSDIEDQPPMEDENILELVDTERKILRLLEGVRAPLLWATGDGRMYWQARPGDGEYKLFKKLYFDLAQLVGYESFDKTMREDYEVTLSQILHLASEAVIAMMTIAEILTAKGMPIAHFGDLSPGQFLRTGDNKVNLADLGAIVLVNSMQRFFNILYAAPETLDINRRGQPWTKRDERPDVYAMGRIIFDMITKDKPKLAWWEEEEFRDEQGRFDQNKQDDYIERVLKELFINYPDAPRKSNYSYGVPDELIAVIKKATQYDPEKRYQTLNDFLYDLRIAFQKAKVHEAKVEERLETAGIHIALEKIDRRITGRHEVNSDTKSRPVATSQPTPDKQTIQVNLFDEFKRKYPYFGKTAFKVVASAGVITIVALTLMATCDEDRRVPIFLTPVAQPLPTTDEPTIALATPTLTPEMTGTLVSEQIETTPVTLLPSRTPIPGKAKGTATPTRIRQHPSETPPPLLTRVVTPEPTRRPTSTPADVVIDSHDEMSHRHQQSPEDKFPNTRKVAEVEYDWILSYWAQINNTSPPSRDSIKTIEIKSTGELLILEEGGAVHSGFYPPDNQPISFEQFMPGEKRTDIMEGVMFTIEGERVFVTSLADFMGNHPFLKIAEVVTGNQPLLLIRDQFGNPRAIQPGEVDSKTKTIYGFQFPLTIGGFTINVDVAAKKWIVTQNSGSAKPNLNESADGRQPGDPYALNYQQIPITKRNYAPEVI